MSDKKKEKGLDAGVLLLTKQDLATLLRCDERSIQRLNRERRLPEPIQLFNNKPLWVRRTIERWINDGCPYVGPVPPPNKQDGSIDPDAREDGQ